MSVRKTVAVISAMVFAFLCCACGDSPSQGKVTTHTVSSHTFRTTQTETFTTADTEKTTITDTTTSSVLKSSVSSAGKTTTTVKTAVSSATTQKSKKAADEMRGAWISYIEISEMLNSSSTAAQMQKKIDALLDRLLSFRVNTVFFHVRANSDAYYPSSIFKAAPAIKALQDKGFDLVSYAINACHKRNMEFHAWVNPYRIGSKVSYRVGDTPYFSSGTLYYYVPTEKASQTLILNGISELLTKYKIDGVHFDDFFYPTGALNETTVYDFEKEGYAAYQKSGGTLSVGDWRRAAVDTLMSSVYRLADAKGKIFGISPTHNAAKNHDSMYADTKKWIAQKGYVHYLCPQIYFGFEHSSSAFDKMVDLWMSYPRDKSVKLYVGLAVYKAGLKSDTYAGNGKTEWLTHNDILARSVNYIRQKKLPGFILYSASYLTPSTRSGLSSSNDVAVAQAEIDHLLAVL